MALYKLYYLLTYLLYRYPAAWLLTPNSLPYCTVYSVSIVLLCTLHIASCVCIFSVFCYVNGNASSDGRTPFSSSLSWLLVMCVYVCYVLYVWQNKISSSSSSFRLWNSWLEYYASFDSLALGLYGAVWRYFDWLPITWLITARSV